MSFQSFNMQPLHTQPNHTLNYSQTKSCGDGRVAKQQDCVNTLEAVAADLTTVGSVYMAAFREDEFAVD